MSVDKDNVIKIANLSKISFKDDEIEKFQEDLSQIIDWVDQLSEANTETVSPTFSSFDNILLSTGSKRIILLTEGLQ